jgi:hypothetical protein
MSVVQRDLLSGVQSLKHGLSAAAKICIRRVFRLLEKLDAGMQVAALDERDGVIHLRIHVRGVELHGFLQLKRGLLPITPAGEQSSEIRSGPGVVGVEGQRCPEGNFRAVQIFRLCQHRAQIVVRIREVGLEFDRLSQV